jgi:hypothetical protein
MRYRLSHFALVIGALLPLGAEAVPFSNGNFALPGLPASSAQPIGPGTEPTFWVAGGTASTSSFALFYENGLFGLPSVPLVGFGGNGTSGATLSQTFDTLAGTNYSVRFQVTPQQGFDPSQSLLAQALNGSAILASSSIGIPLLGVTENFHFYDEMFNFVAGSSTTTLRFTDTTTGGTAANFSVGNVSVNGNVAPVPEPETYGLMLAGLGVLGFAARRRKQRAVTA